MMKLNCWIQILFLSVTALSCFEAKKPEEKPEWAKKDLRDYSDADLEKLYEQWEEDDEPLELDELPDYDPRKPQPSVDFSKLDMSDPESILKATKKGKTLIMFVKVNGNPTREETEEITSIWQTGLWNTHIQADRFLLEDDRVIFMFKDGALAFEAKDYFINEERCEDVQVDQKTYCGKYSKNCTEDQKDSGKKKKASKKKKSKGKKNKKDEL